MISILRRSKARLHRAGAIGSIRLDVDHSPIDRSITYVTMTKNISYHRYPRYAEEERMYSRYAVRTRFVTRSFFHFTRNVHPFTPATLFSISLECTAKFCAAISNSHRFSDRFSVLPFPVYHDLPSAKLYARCDIR